jgi:hypothetical protein
MARLTGKVGGRRWQWQWPRHRGAFCAEEGAKVIIAEIDAKGSSAALAMSAAVPHRYEFF